MSVIALNEIAPRWYDARFPFDQRLIEQFKQIPGATWQAEKKCWKLPHHALPALDALKIQHRILSRSMRPWPAPLEALMPRLRPYQQEDLRRMMTEPAFILAYHPRVGKTPTASVGIASALACGFVKTAVVLYPNSVRGEWEKQFPAFTMGLPFHAVDGTKPFDPTPFETMPWLVLGLHYELLRAEDGKESADGKFEPAAIIREVLNLIYRRGSSMAVADEAHLIVNRKSPRAQLFTRIGEMSAMRWVLDGTPLRSKPRDMWPIWQFLQPGGMGSASKYGVRYADGHQGDHGWVDSGSSNEAELQARLHSIWVKRTRQDVAPWLPKADRRIILCDMSSAQAKAYRALEVALGNAAMAAFEGSGAPAAVTAMKELANSVSAAKLPVLLERARYHVDDRGVKLLVFALHHETLQRAWAALKAAAEQKQTPFTGTIFIAGGWMVPNKRKENIEAWKAHKGGAVLLVNTLSSGTGIDLADADTAVGLETAWVPSDFVQMEARIEDVHQGKRTTPPLLEYLLVRNTIDEDMVTKLITKLNTAELVTGTDATNTSMAQSLRAAGIVDRHVLTLASEDPEIVGSVLDGLRARLTAAAEGDASLYDTPDNNEAAEEADDEEETTDDDE